MSLYRCSAFSLALALGIGGLAFPADGQDNTAAGAPATAKSGPSDAARRQILTSERWQRARHGLDQWLSVQQLYSPQEVSVLRAEFQSRVDRMSPEELQQQLTEMEGKLAVLSSPEAEEARRWLAQFLAVQAKYTDEELRARRPDIANMTASQIRAELAKFQQRRGMVRQSQAAVEQGRALQLQSAQNVHAARQQASEQARQSAAGAAALAADRNQMPAPGTNLPGHSEPTAGTMPLIYTVGPWGNPIRWDPLAGFW